MRIIKKSFIASQIKLDNETSAAIAWSELIRNEPGTMRQTNFAKSLLNYQKQFDIINYEIYLCLSYLRMAGKSYEYESYESTVVELESFLISKWLKLITVN